MYDAIIEARTRQAADLKAQIEARFAKAETERRDLNDAEDREVTGLRKLREEALADLQEARQKKAAEDAFLASEARDPRPVFFGQTPAADKRSPAYSQMLTRAKAGQDVSAPRAYVTAEPEVYRRDNGHEVSFFRDMYAAKSGDWAAADRLHRNAQAAELRAGDLASSSSSTGGSFAPPLWMVEDYIRLARASRTTANVLQHMPLPQGVSSINIPKVATGTATAAQNGQNTTLQDTAATTSSVTANIHTVGGKQIVSLQMLSQSAIPFDQVVLGDLAADAARTLDTYVIQGTGSSGQPVGIRTGGTAVSYTTGSPVVAGTTPANSFMAALTRAINTVNTTRFLPPDAIVMTPSRWSWVLEAVDGQGRPLIVPDAAGTSFNSFGSQAGVIAEGRVGSLLGLPVYIDQNIPQNLGVGTNQDEVYVMRSSDIWFYESEPRLEAFDATYADQASVLFRTLTYIADPIIRYAGSLAVVGGTGLVAPSL